MVREEIACGAVVEGRVEAEGLYSRVVLGIGFCVAGLVLHCFVLLCAMDWRIEELSGEETFAVIFPVLRF